MQKEKDRPGHPVDVDIPALRRRLDEFISQRGFRFYTYVAGRVVGGARVTNFDPRERPFHLTNIPEDWRNHYSQEQFYDHDPMMLYALRNIVPENWSKIIDTGSLSERQHDIVSGAEEAGMRDGIILPIHGPGGEFAVLSLTHGETAKQAAANVDADEAALLMFAMRFHNLVRGILEPGTPEPRELLTSREIDVLFWTAEGKSTWDISQILGISESTVNFHINSVKRKLNVYSKSHAVAKMYSFVESGKF